MTVRMAVAVCVAVCVRMRITGVRMFVSVRMCCIAARRSAVCLLLLLLVLGRGSSGGCGCGCGVSRCLVATAHCRCVCGRCRCADVSEAEMSDEPCTLHRLIRPHSPHHSAAL